MLTTTFFAFLSGIVTVASPCVLPVLPFLLSGALGGRSRPYGIIVGFIASFTLFTLFLSSLVQATGISSDALRLVSVGLLLTFGLVLAVPQLHTWYERVSSGAMGSLGNLGQTQKNGFAGGVMVGATLGLLWTPCVGPIMASVITLALSGNVTGQAFLTTLAFSLGTAIPMLAVMLGGRTLLNRANWLMNNLSRVQRGFGVILVVFALGIGFNVDRAFQTWVLDTFPAYADFLVQLEEVGSK
ncbi:MAG: cytochrome c biogenesis CcdA family protein [Deinococcales bacterium]